MHLDRPTHRRKLLGHPALHALAASLAFIACSDAGHQDSLDTATTRQAVKREVQRHELKGERGQSIPREKLPTIDPLQAVETFMERLREPTETGENVAVHFKLPAPSNPRLEGSLVRVLGDEESPLVVYSSDALVRLGKLKQSPGRGFFTAFLRLDERELELRATAEREVAGINEPSKTTLVFEGRTPVAITSGIAIDVDGFFNHLMIPLGFCPVAPASTLPRWLESLTIVDPTVVQDPMRTQDPCRAGPGDPNGVWTFKHLMTEMATGSGLSTHDFVVSWLSRWLQPYSVNGDTVPARTQMFNQVIAPWANASGVTAVLSPSGVLTLSGPLNLDIAPFRLSAIVNRIDLGGTVDGPAGYGGGTTSRPTDAGELRFIFGAQNLNTCNVLEFAAIFEYGVPIEGCGPVRGWAKKWTKLNDPGFAAPFSAAWRAHLESLTQSVVVHGAAPAKGNQSALNQLRTNEVALAFPWELREFHLAIEDAVADVDTPTNGPLRPHTVAMTPDDAVFMPPPPHPTVDNFVLGPVFSSVPPSVPTLPDDCSATFSVPGQFLGAPFRGGNSLTAPPTHWEANVNPADNRQLCARHEFSLNTCSGCHFGDTSTGFYHVQPQTMPAVLSNFLTGGPGGIWSVPDTQFGAPPNWTFADLDRRFKRLYEIAFCTTCGLLPPFFPGVLDFVAELNGGVPIDPIGPVVKPPFPVRPVKDLEIVARLLEKSASFVDPKRASNVEVERALRAAETFVH